MIDRVHFENFKSLQNVTLGIGRLTALVGANGCGKTSILQAIRMVSQGGQEVRTDIKDDVDPFTSVFSGRRQPQRLIYGGAPGVITLAIKHSDGDELTVRIPITKHLDTLHASHVDFIVGSEKPIRIEATHSSVKPNRSLELAALGETRIQKFASTAYLQLDAYQMMQTSFAEDEAPRMQSNGTGLASALAWMKGAAEDELADLTVNLQKIIPGVKRIRTLRERRLQRGFKKTEIDNQPIWRPVDEPQIGDKFAIEFEGGLEVPADLLSEGTVLTLGLLTKLHEPGRPRLLLVDDIDRGLHLGAQSSLIKVLRELLELDSELQIICTTHSPYLLDLFQAEEIRVLALDAERRTHVRPLIEHPDFDKWKFGTQTGELWAALGEEWVIDGANG